MPRNPEILLPVPGLFFIAKKKLQPRRRLAAAVSERNKRENGAGFIRQVRSQAFCPPEHIVYAQIRPDGSWKDFSPGFIRNVTKRVSLISKGFRGFLSFFPKRSVTSEGQKKSAAPTAKPLFSGSNPDGTSETNPAGSRPAGFCFFLRQAGIFFNKVLPGHFSFPFLFCVVYCPGTE